MRTADHIAEFLIEKGIEDVFLLTGNGAMYLNDGVGQRMKCYCARNEAAAPVMAESYARIRGVPGAVCLTAGPGSTNAVPGLAEAWVDSAPVLVFSGQVPNLHVETSLRTFGTAGIDIVSIVRPVTKYAVTIQEPRDVLFHVEKGYRLATQGRPGPVWFDIPLDVQSATVSREQMRHYTQAECSQQSRDEEQAYIRMHAAKVADLLRSAERPLLIVGQGVRQGGAIDELYQLVQQSSAPVLLSRLGQDLLPFSHPLNFGQTGIKGSRYCSAITRSADVVLSLGCRLAVSLVGQEFEAFARTAKVVMVDLDETELKKRAGVQVHTAIRADVGQFMHHLLRELGTLPGRSDWIQYCQELKAANPMVTPSMGRNPIDLYYFMSRLDACATARHIFTTDAGSNYYVGGQVYRFEHGQRELTSGAFAAMGISVPLAIGAAIAAPKKQILAVTGDGSLELNIQELKTISFYKLNIKLFVINNGGYVSMRNWQDSFFDGRRIETSDQNVLDFQSVAQAFDLRYARIDRYEDIDQRLREIMSDDLPLFVEVVCDPNQRIHEPSTDLPLFGK